MFKTPLALALTLFATPALAAFEGTVEMKISMKNGEGKMLVSVGKPGVRNDMDMVAGGQPMKMAWLVKKDDPEKAYMINDKTKSYSEIDLSQAKKASPKKDQKYTAKKLGKEKIAGKDTIHVEAKDEKGNVVEVWTTKDLDLDSSFFKTMGDNAPNQGLMAALKDIDADGFVLKLVNRASNEAVTMEVTKITEKSLPASTFEVPSGYTKGTIGAAALTPEQHKMMEEKMKNMTPEQRRAMEQYMKGQSK